MKLRKFVAATDEKPYFCILPWIHIRLNPDGETYPCCKMRWFYSYGSLRKNSLQEIWNGKPIRDLRNQMLSGERNPLCEDCYQTEKSGCLSERERMNSKFEGEIESVQDTESDGSVKNMNIRSLDLRLSNTCNLRCRTCGPQYSTAWYADAKRLNHPVVGLTTKAVLMEQMLYDFIEPLSCTLKLLYFAGGEPLRDRQHSRLLEYLIDRNCTQMELDYNSNFTSFTNPDGKSVLQLWSNFKTVTLGASLDGVNEQFEYIRKGGKWETAEVNFRQLLQARPEVNFFIFLTLSVLNAFHVTEAIQKFLEIGMINSTRRFELSILHEPAYLSVLILNEEERSFLEVHYSFFLQKLQSCIETRLFQQIETQLNKVIFYLKMNLEIGDRKKFRLFSFSLDRIRKEQTARLFPELFNLITEDSTGNLNN